MRLIRFQDRFDDPIFINPRQVVAVAPSDDPATAHGGKPVTEILTVNDRVFKVIGTADAVSVRLVEGRS